MRNVTKKQKFSLRPIRTEADHDAAMLAIRPLAVKGEDSDGKEHLTRGERDYLDTMVTLLEEYDRTYVSDLDSELSPVDLLKGVMENQEMTISDLAKAVGISQPLASTIVHGKRGISKPVARKLAGRFKVDA
jgi:antitoxin component HigA of HigAB toxin-antitoxin module